MTTTCDTFRYNSLDMVCNRLSRNDYMCCTDIRAAYRSIAIRTEHWQYQGFKWSDSRGKPVYYYDTRLSFGQKCAPYIFNEISNFVVECMARRGFVKVVNYLDDYFCWGSSFNECAATQNALITLLGELGFRVAWNKCSSPSTTCIFLGIQINSVDMSMSLPQGKMQKLYKELAFFTGKDRATIKQLQRLCGILSYASYVVRGGWTFSRRIIDLLKGVSAGTTRVRLSHQFKLDLEWWNSWTCAFNGKATMIKHNFGQGHGVHTDTSLSVYGVTSSQSWYAGYFNSQQTPTIFSAGEPLSSHWINLQIDEGACHNINILELVPVWLACVLWGKGWKDQQIICWSDNTQVVLP